MNELQKKIMIRAIKIRLAQGEQLEEILKTWVNLTEPEKTELKNVFK